MRPRKKIALFAVVAAAGLLFAGGSGMRAQPVTTSGDCSPVVMEVTGDVSIVCNIGGPAGPRFRVSYYRVGGIGLAFLLDGLLSPEWEERLGGQQAIIQNPVSKEARKFLDRFATPIGGTHLYGRVGSGDMDVSADLAEYARSVDPTIETIPADGGDMPVLDEDRWRAYFGSGRYGELFVPDVEAARTLFSGDGWPEGYGAVYGGRWERNPPALRDGALSAAPFLWRWMTQDDLDGFEEGYRAYVGRVLDKAFPTSGGAPFDVIGDETVDDVLASWQSAGLARTVDSIRYLAREGLPERFLLVEGWLGVHYGWSFVATPRDFQLLVAVIENVSAQPVEFGDFRLRETLDMSLRLAEKTDADLDAAAEENRRIFPIGVLSPGEKILVPVRIELPQSDIYDDFQDELDAAGERGAGIENALRAAGDAPVAVQDDNLETLFTKPASAFPPQSVPQIVERFEYGPAWRIDSVTVGGEEVALRQHDPNQFVLLAGVEVGSCPFAFTWQSDGGFWRNEGHFLLGATGRENKRTEEKPLPHFEGRVMIRELEHEIAVLDMIRLRLTGADGRETIHLPSRAELRATDGRELTLAYGEEIELDFGLSEADWRGKEASLVASGFYVDLGDPELFAGAGDD